MTASVKSICRTHSIYRTRLLQRGAPEQPDPVQHVVGVDAALQDLLLGRLEELRDDAGLRGDGHRRAGRPGRQPARGPVHHQLLDGCADVLQRAAITRRADAAETAAARCPIRLALPREDGEGLVVVILAEPLREAREGDGGVPAELHNIPTFVSLKPTCVSLKPTFVSLKPTCLSLQPTCLSLKPTFLSLTYQQQLQQLPPEGVGRGRRGVGLHRGARVNQVYFILILPYISYEIPDMYGSQYSQWALSMQAREKRRIGPDRSSPHTKHTGDDGRGLTAHVIDSQHTEVACLPASGRTSAGSARRWRRCPRRR